MGVDDQGVIAKFLNSNSEIVDDVKIGGVGYAVQFGLNKWKV